MRIGIATRVYPGETVCGDAASWWTEDTSTLVCIADGLGHGAAAHLAARSLLAVAEARAGTDVSERLAAADRAIRHTRGAAAAIVRIDPGARTVSVAAVGNIQGALFGGRARRFDGVPGIVGANIRPVKPLTFDITPEDILVLWTDGLLNLDLGEDLRRHRHDPDRLAALLMGRFGRYSDDCAVLCVDLGGDEA